MSRKLLVGSLLTVMLVVVVLLFLFAQPRTEPHPTEQTEVKYFFSGDSGEVTPAFHIPTRKWKIYFTVQAPNNSFFKFMVYREDSGIPLTETPDLYNTAVSQIIVEEGPGDFYLVVTSSLAYWEITVTSMSE